MKNIALLAITFIISISAISQSDYSNWQTVESKHYSLKCPPDWKIDVIGDIGITMMSSSALEGDGDRFKENFGVLVRNHSQAPMSLEAFAEEQVGEVKNDMDNTTFLGSQRMESENGEEMYRITYVKNQNGMELLYDSRAMMINDFSYMMIFTLERSKYPDYKDVVQQIVESLEIK